MSMFNALGISDALATTATTVAQTPHAQTAGGLASFLPMMLIFVAGAYFLMIRPQNKRLKAHRKLLADLTKGDEVVSAGGIVGKVAKVQDDFVSLTVADNVEITLQKSAISTVLPKGTLKAL